MVPVPEPRTVLAPQVYTRPGISFSFSFLDRSVRQKG